MSSSWSVLIAGCSTAEIAAATGRHRGGGQPEARANSVPLLLAETMLAALANSLQKLNRLAGDNQLLRTICKS